MTLHRSTAGGLLMALTALLLVLLAPTADAASGTYLRLAHLSPDTPTVDVLVTSFSGETVTLKGVSYGDVSTYKRIEPGRYTVAMRLAGAPESSPAIVSGTLDAQDGRAYTAAGLGPRAGLTVNVLSDDLARPGAGQARVRVVQGAEQAGPIDVRWNSAPVVGGVAFATATDYVTVPAGTGTFDITPTTGAATSVPLRLEGGGVYSVIVVQRGGVLATELRTDAIGPADAPNGGIETGYGGTADPLPATPAAPLLAAGGILAALLLVGMSRRARRASR